jgi:2-dehydropantoate 2-reductase
MRLLVGGAGAIGGTLAAYFARAGHQIVCVDVVEEHVRAIADRGLHVTGPIDDFVAWPEACTPDDVAGEFPAILLCVKSQDTEDTTAMLEPHLGPQGYVASFQNGLNELVIADIVGRQRTVGAFINFAAEYMEPGVVLYGGRGAVVVGELDGARTARIEALHGLCLAFDKGALLSPDIMSYLWGKLIYGGFLRVTALADMSIAGGLEAPELRPLFVALAREILAVAGTEGIDPHGFNGFEPDAFRHGTDSHVLTRTFEAMVRFNRASALTHASVWRDLTIRKRRTDTGPQFAPMLRIAATRGIAAPVTRRLIEVMTEIEEGRLGVGPAALERLGAGIA